MAETPDRAKSRELYEELRGVALSSTPAKAGFQPGIIGPGRACGGLMEFKADDIDATLFCVLEEGGRYVHVAFYTSGRFMILGENFPPAVLEAARCFIDRLSEVAQRMAPATSFPGPSTGATRFYAFTEAGVRTLDAAGADHQFHPLLIAGHSVVAELHKVVPP